MLNPKKCLENRNLLYPANNLFNAYIVAIFYLYPKKSKFTNTQIKQIISEKP